MVQKVEQAQDRSAWVVGPALEVRELVDPEPSSVLQDSTRRIRLRGHKILVVGLAIAEEAHWGVLDNMERMHNQAELVAGPALPMPRFAGLAVQQGQIEEVQHH